MTATNHAITGALIASVIDKPLIALPLAFLSHFVLDALPHFGVEVGDVFKRNVTWQFRTVLISDITLTLIMFFTLLALLPQHRLLTGSCMFLATSPDLVWGYRFFRELKTGKYRPPKDLFSKFHLNIQWSETPRGALVEFIWFIAITALVFNQQ